MSKNLTESFKNVLKLEADGLIKASKKITEDQMSRLIEIYRGLSTAGGSLIFCGVGKSGDIAKKMCSTFSSLGLPSFFLHPIDALHGDMGRVKEWDALVLVSNSGTTEEILKLLSFVPIPKERRIGLIGVESSPLWKNCELNFDCSVEKEACINNLAPTSSTTLALAIGDAMAVIYEEFVGLSKEGFAVNHPAGLLGKSLRLKVSDLMTKASRCPKVNKQQTLKEVILAMTEFPLGACAVLNESNEFVGILTEGDIRRTFTKQLDGLETTVDKIFSSKAKVINSQALAIKAMELMEDPAHQVYVLPVVDEGVFKGLIRMHDLLEQGFNQKS